LLTAIKQPKNELSWEDRPKNLVKIKVGDLLWIGQGQHPCSQGIKPVTRLTNTLIVIGEGKNNWEKFRRMNGYQVGGSGFNSSYISAIATPAEVEEFKLAEQQKKEEREKIQKKQQALDTLQAELNALFGESEMIHVRFEDFNTTAVIFSLTFSGLTPEQIRSMAPKLRRVLHESEA
jgi:hypothetical protein